jgi:hypothetical protein
MADRWERSGDADPAAPIEIGPQPDPMLIPGRASLLQECLVAIAIVAVVTVVFYGLNHNAPENSGMKETQTASTSAPAPQAPQTTGQAPQAAPSEGKAQPGRPETPSATDQDTR